MDRYVLRFDVPYVWFPVNVYFFFYFKLSKVVAVFVAPVSFFPKHLNFKCKSFNPNRANGELKIKHKGCVQVLQTFCGVFSFSKRLSFCCTICQHDNLLNEFHHRSSEISSSVCYTVNGKGFKLLTS